MTLDINNDPLCIAIRELHSKGLINKEIAKRLNVRPQRVSHKLKKMKLRPNEINFDKKLAGVKKIKDDRERKTALKLLLATNPDKYTFSPCKRNVGDFYAYTDESDEGYDIKTLKPLSMRTINDACFEYFVNDGQIIFFKREEKQ